MKKILLFIVMILSLAVMANALTVVDKEYGKCVSNCLTEHRIHLRHCDDIHINSSKICKSALDRCIAITKNMSTLNARIERINECKATFATCEAAAETADKLCKANVTQSCNNFCDVMSCHNYYWFDNTHKECTKKKFCGVYQYFGLHVFDTKEECVAAQNITNRTCEQMRADMDVEIAKLSVPCTTNADCSIAHLKTPCAFLQCQPSAISKTANLTRINNLFDEYNTRCITVCPMSASLLCLNQIQETAICKSRKCIVEYDPIFY